MTYSTNNIQNSFSTTLTGLLQTSGYAIYYLQTDLLAVPGMVQTNYASSAAVNAFLPEVQAFRALPGYRGVMTLTDGVASLPTYATRPEKDGSVPGLGGIAVPALAIDVQPVEHGMLWEIGSTLRERTQLCIIAGLARNDKESVFLTDLLNTAFEPNTHLDIRDHDAGTLDLLGSVEIVNCGVTRNVVDRAGSVLAYEIAAGLSLWYVA